MISSALTAFSERVYVSIYVAMRGSKDGLSLLMCARVSDLYGPTFAVCSWGIFVSVEEERRGSLEWSQWWLFNLLTTDRRRIPISGLDGSMDSWRWVTVCQRGTALGGGVIVYVYRWRSRSSLSMHFDVETPKMMPSVNWNLFKRLHVLCAKPPLHGDSSVFSLFYLLVTFLFLMTSASSRPAQRASLISFVSKWRYINF